jgi:hypothetical protein
MGASRRLKLTLMVALLVGASAFGQADQSTATQPTAQQPISQGSTSQQPTAPPPGKPRPATPHPVVDAARASKQLQESAPATKVYRNKDVKDPADISAASSSAAATSAGAVAAQTPSVPAPHATASTSNLQTQKDRAFEAKAAVFKSQILVEKGKIADIQSDMRSLKYQFDQWSTEFAQDPTDAQACWTSTYYTLYYKDWCDTGRNLKAQYDAAQRQLDQEKVHLDQMQENIRRQGYGNGVYDPD